MNILLVDDEPIVLESLERLLTTLGSDTWEIVCANSGSTALDVMTTSHVDLIITDMRMPGMDGAALLTAIAARWPQVARIALSAEASQLQAIRAAGVAHQFLGKPCRAETMLAALNRLEGLSIGPEATAVRAIVGAVPRLPVLPTAYAELRRVLADPRGDIREVTEVIRQDPTIVAKVMQLASSSFFFRGSAVADLHGAVSRLGALLITRLVLVEGLLSTISIPARFGYAEEASRFFRAAVVAEAVVAPSARDEATLAVLLCPIGRAVMIAADPTRADEAMELAATARISMMAAERQVFGTCHAAVGGHLISLWGLSPEVAHAVTSQHTPAAYRAGDEALAATFLANRSIRGVELDAGFTAAPGITALVAAWDRHTTRLGEV